MSFQTTVDSSLSILNQTVFTNDGKYFGGYLTSTSLAPLTLLSIRVGGISLILSPSSTAFATSVESDSLVRAT